VQALGTGKEAVPKLLGKLVGMMPSDAENRHQTLVDVVIHLDRRGFLRQEHSPHATKDFHITTMRRKHGGNIFCQPSLSAGIFHNGLHTSCHTALP
jgi:hypothetical protein